MGPLHMAENKSLTGVFTPYKWSCNSIHIWFCGSPRGGVVSLPSNNSERGLIGVFMGPSTKNYNTLRLLTPSKVAILRTQKTPLLYGFKPFHWRVQPGILRAQILLVTISRKGDNPNHRTLLNGFFRDD